MKNPLLTLLLLCCFALPAQAVDRWPEIKWEALLPPGWNPASPLQNLDLSSLNDSDPRAIEALEKLRQKWDNAPANPALNGRRIRIAGYTLPLERRGQDVIEFLLVPYYGACIHTPPPPANQIIHAKSAQPLSGVQLMTPVWVYGTLHVQRHDTIWGVAGYTLTVERVRPWQAPPRPKR